jgi:hypothetical protein
MLGTCYIIAMLKGQFKNLKLAGVPASFTMLVSFPYPVKMNKPRLDWP